MEDSDLTHQRPQIVIDYTMASADHINVPVRTNHTRPSKLSQKQPPGFLNGTHEICLLTREGGYLRANDSLDELFRAPRQISPDYCSQIHHSGMNQSWKKFKMLEGSDIELDSELETVTDSF